ncbi:MAG: putative bifunctional diguanylate cyclase/phosphodiesterase, partial [Actinomycetota bacterium]
MSIYLCVGAVLTALYFLVPPFRAHGGVFILLGLSSPVAIVLGTRIHRPPQRTVWYLLAAGQVAFFLGDLVYYGYKAVRHVELPFPSVGDVFYLATYPFL